MFHTGTNILLPENIWFLFNKIYDCEYGIRAGSASNMGFGRNAYFIGNVIYDIHYDPVYHGDSWDDYENIVNSSWSNSALNLLGAVNRYAIGNTIYDVDAGINAGGGGNFYIADNLISLIPGTRGESHIWVEDEGSNTEWKVDNNLVYQPDSAGRIRHYGTVYTAATLPVENGTNNIDADPGFIDAQNNDFHLRGGSPAMDAGTSSGIVQEVFDTFEKLYGINIRNDYDGNPRPQGAEWDIGAFELQSIYALISADPSSGNPPLAVTFNGSGSASVAGDITDYEWDFGDGAAAYGVEVTHIYNDIGTYTVSLTVTDSGGATATSTRVITVIDPSANQPPVADAGDDQMITDTDGNGFEQVMLDGSGSADPDGSITGYVWEEGATQIATGANPPPVILSTGTHIIRLTVTDDDSAADDDTVVINVNVPGNNPPAAESQSVATDENTPVAITLAGSDPDGDPVAYAVISTPAHGSLTGAAPNLTYTPAADYHGQDSFTFVVNDGIVSSNQAAVSITVNEVSVADPGPDPEPDPVEPEDTPAETKMRCYNNVINPTKGEESTVRIELDKPVRVTVVIYNNQGKEVKKLMDEEKQPGFYQLKWDGKDNSENTVGSGIYMVHIEAGSYKETKKAAVIK